MVELGILGENDKIELLDGRIVENSDLKPVLDDAKCRSFESTAEYRQWCEENLPDWLGYGRV
ncbi:MAG: hypothetical protein FWD61_11375 [Phycisphaerales bacterium]|nr:hypothetical protein [Phycisphaerales bacterium]